MNLSPIQKARQKGSVFIEFALSFLVLFSSLREPSNSVTRFTPTTRWSTRCVKGRGMHR
jgi:hypothetical protein